MRKGDLHEKTECVQEGGTLVLHGLSKIYWAEHLFGPTGENLRSRFAVKALLI